MQPLKEMKRKKRYLSNEKGSVTIEFIGILPLVFLIMLICWQFLIGAYAVITAQAAANEAAKVFAITQNESEALAAAQNIVEAAGGGIGYASGSVSFNDSGFGFFNGGYFTAQVDVSIDLVFLPEIIRKNMSPEQKEITFSREIKSRVIN